MLPARFAPALFGLILSGLMSLVVSGNFHMLAHPVQVRISWRSGWAHGSWPG